MWRRKSRNSFTAGDDRGSPMLRARWCPQPWPVLASSLALLAAVGLVACRARVNSRQGAVVAGKAMSACIRLRLQQYTKISGMHILQARRGHALLAMHNGVIGVLSLQNMEIVHGIGTPWGQIVVPRRNRSLMPVTMFAEPPAVSPDGRYFVALTSTGRQVRLAAALALHTRWQIWSIARKRALATISHRGLHGVLVPPRGPQRFFYTDGGQKLAGFGGGSLYFFGARSLRLKAAPFYSYYVIGLDAERRGRYLLALCSQPGRVEVWDSQTGRKVVIITPPPGVNWDMVKLGAAVGGNRVAVSWGHYLALYRADTGQCLARRQFNGKCSVPAFAPGGEAVSVCVGSRFHGKQRRVRCRVEVFAAAKGLTLRATSPFLHTRHPVRVRLNWWGPRRLVECSAGWLAIWHLVGVGG